MTGKSLDARMKEYEDVWSIHIPQRMPVILRLDGRAFHTLLKDATKPFDMMFGLCMQNLALYLYREVQNTVLIYGFSDELSLLLHDYKTLDTQPWFGNELQKIVSISAAAASAYLTSMISMGRMAQFDSRAFVLPESEVCNYFIWRQRDCMRNCINSYAQQYLSQKELDGLNMKSLIELLADRGIHWDTPHGLTAARHIPNVWKHGFTCTDEGIDYSVPLFQSDRNYVEQYLAVKED